MKINAPAKQYGRETPKSKSIRRRAIHTPAISRIVSNILASILAVYVLKWAWEYSKLLYSKQRHIQCAQYNLNCNKNDHTHPHKGADILTNSPYHCMGNAVMPVLKLTGNPKSFAEMGSMLDFNAGTVMEGMPIAEAGL